MMGRRREAKDAAPVARADHAAGADVVQVLVDRAFAAEWYAGKSAGTRVLVRANRAMTGGAYTV